LGGFYQNGANRDHALDYGASLASEPRSAARMSAPNINFKTMALRQNHVGDDLDGDAPRQTAVQINLNWWCASLGDGSIGAERRAALWDQIYG
jgi:hypothetical protein